MIRRASAFVVALLVGAFFAEGCARAASQQQQPQQNGTVKTDNGRIRIGISGAAPANTPKTAAGDTSDDSLLARADQLLANGKVNEAQPLYQQVAQRKPSSVRAQVGLIRTFTMQEKFAEAQSAVDTALVLQPQSEEIYLAQGDLQFAWGKIGDAERTYIKAEQLKPADPMPHVQLARVYRSYSLFRRAYDQMKRAHELAPNDVPVQLLWFNSLPQPDRVAQLQDYLADPKLSPQAAKTLQQYLAFLKRSADAPEHECRLVSAATQTEVKLYAIARGGSELGANGLNVRVNKQDMHLALDTGTAGILLGRAAAEKLGLQRLAYHPIVGLGDQGQQGGFTSVAERIRVGDLEFTDCIVRVTDKATPVTGQDGLIGTDVFGAYLVDMDIPGAKLKLTPLPKRPDEAAEPGSLKTTTRDSQELETERKAKSAAGAAANLPKDAYVAPEMKDWTKVFRFRNLLLVPTKVDNTGPLLFLMDTGTYNNVLSTRTAQQLAQLRSDPSMHISGMSGSVGNVYRADKATLQFGRYEQANQDVVTFNLDSMSRQTQTLVSGILGYNMLRILEVKIDYRDGLVDFTFDPKRLPKQIKLNAQ
jgi:tetratricopeptide (TPR) repeat protein